MDLTTNADRKVYLLSDEEDTKINAGIAADPDAREIMDDQSCRDPGMVRNFVERKFNYSIFSQNTDSGSDDMLATISFNLRHSLAYQRLNAYSTGPIYRLVYDDATRCSVDITPFASAASASAINR